MRVFQDQLDDLYALYPRLNLSEITRTLLDRAIEKIKQEAQAKMEEDAR